MILLSSTGENIFQLIIVLFCFLIVLALTYYVTRWIAGYQKSQSISKNLSVVETLKLTTNKYIQLIQAGKDTYYVIAIGKDEITVLGQLSGEQLKEMPSQNMTIPTAILPMPYKSSKNIYRRSRHEYEKQIKKRILYL